MARRGQKLCVWEGEGFPGARKTKTRRAPARKRRAGGIQRIIWSRARVNKEARYLSGRSNGGGRREMADAYFTAKRCKCEEGDAGTQSHRVRSVYPHAFVEFYTKACKEHADIADAAGRIDAVVRQFMQQAGDTHFQGAEMQSWPAYRFDLESYDSSESEDGGDDEVEDDDVSSDSESATVDYEHRSRGKTRWSNPWPSVEFVMQTRTRRMRARFVTPRGKYCPFYVPVLIADATDGAGDGRTIYVNALDPWSSYGRERVANKRADCLSFVRLIQRSLIGIPG